MNTADNKLSAIRVSIGLYLAGALISYGPMAVSNRDSCVPGPDYEGRRAYVVCMTIFLTPFWPLYWSYRIADRP